MTSATAASIISDYKEGKPTELIKATYGISMGRVSDMLRENGIAMRGRNHLRGKKYRARIPYWNGFLIRPNLDDAERDRGEALRLILNS